MRLAARKVEEKGWNGGQGNSQGGEAHTKRRRMVAAAMAAKVMVEVLGGVT